MPVDLHAELIQVRRELLAMGSLVEERVAGAVQAMVRLDVAEAERIRDTDAEIDRMELQIEEECMRLLALAQPVAGDLRFILTVLRVNGELERIADLAKGVAKRVIRLGRQHAVSIPENSIEMGRRARTMLAEVLSALSDQDPQRCRDLSGPEDEVDRLQKRVLEWVRAQVAADPEQAPAIIDVLTLSQRIERIADMVTNIAGDVIFLVEGRVVRHGNL